MSVIIGIDPHKASHMAVAIDDEEQSLGVLEVVAGRRQTSRLLAWAEFVGCGADVGDRVGRGAGEVVVSGARRGG